MATAEEIELERKKLALEEEKFRSTHALAVRQFEIEKGKHGESFTSKLTKNPMAIVTLVLGVLTCVQYLQSEATKRQESKLAEAARLQEMQIAQARAAADADRLWRVALIEFLEHQRADLFSTDATKRREAIAMLEASFPSDYAGPVLTKLQMLQSGTETPSAKVLASELLEPLLRELSASKAAFDKLGPNDEVNEQAIRAANQKARELLVTKAAMIPPHLRQDAIQLIEHYDAWFAEDERVRDQRRTGQQAPFVFAGTRGIAFPENAERRFREELRKAREKPGG